MMHFINKHIKLFEIWGIILHILVHIGAIVVIVNFRMYDNETTWQAMNLGDQFLMAITTIIGYIASVFLFMIPQAAAYAGAVLINAAATLALPFYIIWGVAALLGSHEAAECIQSSPLAIGGWWKAPLLTIFGVINFIAAWVATDNE